MPVRFSVKLAGEGELLARLGILKKELEGRRRATMHRAVVLIRDEARSRIHSPEGKARRGIKDNVRGVGNELRGYVSSRSVRTIFAQRSRGANRKMPPVKAIRAWLRRTGQLRSKASAFLVARAIARRGTIGHPVMEDALAAKRDEVIALFREMVLQALKRR